MKPTGLPGSLPAGPFTTADARRQRVSRGVLAGNRIDAVLHGVHAVSVAAIFSDRDRMRRLLVAAHLVVPDVVASCMTACVLWGLPVPSRPGRVHVCSSRQVRRPEVLVHRRTVDDHSDLDGIAVTTLVQTFIDVGLEVEASWHLAIGDAIVGRGY